MDIFATYATNKALEQDGVVVFLVDGKTNPAVDPWIKVARIGNTAYSKAIAELAARVKQERKVERLTDEQVEIRSENGMTEVLADTILKGFGNLTFQGKAMPNTRESYMTFLRVNDFRELVFRHASDIDHFLLEMTEEAKGN